MALADLIDTSKFDLATLAGDSPVAKAMGDDPKISLPEFLRRLGESRITSTPKYPRPEPPKPVIAPTPFGLRLDPNGRAAGLWNSLSPQEQQAMLSGTAPTEEGNREYARIAQTASDLSDPGTFLTGLAENALGNSEVGRTVLSSVNKGANLFGISSLFPSLEERQQTFEPESTTGQIVSDITGGGIKSASELGLAATTGITNPTLLFGGTSALSQIAPLVSGEETVGRALINTGVGTATGAAFPYVSRLPGILARIGGAAVLGEAGTVVQAATEDRMPTIREQAEGALGMGIFQALGEAGGHGAEHTPITHADIKSTIVDAAQRNGVPANIMLGLAESESSFDPNAVSPTGATGLFQFTKGTAKEYGVDRTDPVSSADGAARYMKHLIEKHNGDVSAAVAEYKGVSVGGATMKDVANTIGLMDKYKGQVQSTPTNLAQTPEGQPAETVSPVEAVTQIAQETQQAVQAAALPRAPRPEIDLGEHAAYQPGQYMTDEPLIEHEIQNGPNAGTIRTGVIAHDLTMEQARAIDPYAHEKDDGIFIGERHIARPEPIEGAVGAAVAEPIPEGEPNATITGPRPEDGIEEHLGVSHGEDVRPYGSEVRQEESGQASGGGGAIGSPAVGQAPTAGEGIASPDISGQPIEEAASEPPAVNRFEEIRNAANERMRSRRGQLRSLILPFDPRDIGDMALIGASHIAEGVHDFAQWSSKMVRDVGDQIKPYLAELMHVSAREHERTFGELPKELQLPERSEDGPIGIKNAINLAERERFGLTPLKADTPYTDEQANSDAKIVHEVYPERVTALVEELSSKPRTVSKLESNILEVEYAKRAQAVDRATDMVNDARTPEARDSAMQARRAADNEFDKLSEITATVGGEAGRSLQARKAMVDRDKYTLVRMRSALRAELGRDLTPEEETTVQDQHVRAKAAQDVIDKTENEISAKTAVEALDREVREASGKRKGKGAPESASSAQVLDALKTNGEPTQNLLAKLVRAYAREGVPKEEIMSTMHGDLRKLFPGLEERRMRDIFSGYGKPQFPNPAPDAKIAAELHSESQSLSALEDATAGVSPKRSGLQRRKPSEVKRALIRQVRAMMREMGLDAESRAGRLAGALEQAKSRMRNAIDDSEKRLAELTQLKAEGKPLPGRIMKTPLQYDEEANRLKAHLDDIRQSLAEIEGEPKRTPEQVARDTAIKSVEKSMEEYERRIAEADFAAKQRNPGLAANDPVVKELRAGRDLMRAEYERLKKEAEGDKTPSEMTDEDRIELAMKAAQRSKNYWTEQIRRGEEEGAWAKKQNRQTPITPELSEARAQRDAERERFEQLRALADPHYAENVLRDRYRKYVENQVKVLRERTKTLKETKNIPESKTQRDWYAEKDLAIRTAMAERDRIRQEHDAEIERIQRSQRGPTEKLVDAFLDFRRGGVISSVEAFVKIANMGLLRAIQFPIHELGASAIRRIAPGFAAESPRFGSGLNLADLKTYYSSYFGKGMEEAWENLKGNQTDLEIADKGERYRAPGVASKIGSRHAAFKAPAKRAEYDVSTQILSRHYAAQGLEVHSGTIETNPVKAQIHREAMDFSQQTAFLQKNLLSKAQATLTNYLERSATKSTLRGKLASLPVKTIMPIVRIPTNIALETGRMVGGVPWVGTKLAVREIGRLVGKPFEELTPQEHDIMAKQLIHGSVGLAMFLYGALNPEAVGGFFRKERGDHNTDPDEFNLLGVHVSGLMGKVLSHAPPFLAMEMGATMRQIMGEAKMKGDGMAMRITEGMAGAALGMFQKLPLIDAVNEIANVVEGGKQATQYADNIARDILEPQILQSVAKYTDPAWKQGLSRQPEGLKETMESGIPGLRENVPLSRGGVKAAMEKAFRQGDDSTALAIRDDFNKTAIAADRKPLSQSEVDAQLKKTSKSGSFFDALPFEEAIPAYRAAQERGDRQFDDAMVTKLAGRIKEFQALPEEENKLRGLATEFGLADKLEAKIAEGKPRSPEFKVGGDIQAMLKQQEAYSDKQINRTLQTKADWQNPRGAVERMEKAKVERSLKHRSSSPFRLPGLPR
jgi:hypothetical protein